jgi:hypothetical protein
MRDDRYLAEKFANVRHVLMLPHPRGEDESIVEAFHTCRSLLHSLDRSGLDEDARERLLKLDELMNTDGIDDPAGIGTWTIKARQFSVDEKIELSNVIDDLAERFGAASVQSGQD